MNKKRWFWSGVAVLVVYVVLDYIFNTYCLKNIYMQTAGLWRPEAELKELFLRYAWITYIVGAFVFTYIYAKGYEGRPSPVFEGIRFGFWIGLFTTIPMSIMTYITMPIPGRLSFDWFITGMVEMLVAGAVVGLIYKK